MDGVTAAPLLGDRRNGPRPQLERSASQCLARSEQQLNRLLAVRQSEPMAMWWVRALDRTQAGARRPPQALDMPTAATARGARPTLAARSCQRSDPGGSRSRRESGRVARRAPEWCNPTHRSRYRALSPMTSPSSRFSSANRISANGGSRLYSTPACQGRAAPLKTGAKP